MRQVVVVGLDGTRLDTLQFLSQQGVMPNVGRILAAGAFGRLRSVLPPYSAPAWVTMTTGANPGKHGVYDFYQRDARVGSQIPVSSASVAAKPVWHILGDSGHRVSVVNVPITYPPRPLNGVVVSDFLLTPDGDTNYAYPPEVKAQIQQLVPDFHPAPFRTPSRTLAFARQVTEWTDQAEQVCQMIAREYPCSFFMNVFQATDIVQHYFFDYLQPDRLTQTEDPIVAALLHLYRRLDDIVGARLAMLDGETTLVLVSDHGFTRLNRAFHLNRWLQEQGWLALPTPRAHQRLLRRLGVSQRKLVRSLRRLDVLGLLNRLPQAARERMGSRLDQAIGGQIDWQRTRAYAGAVSSQALYLNDRPAAGAMPVQLQAEIVSQLMTALATVTDPATGGPVFQEIYRRQDLYSGPHVDQAPHIVFNLAPGYMVDDKLSVESAFEDVLPAVGTGLHHVDGFFALLGPGIAPSVRPLEAHIADIAPTLLYLLGEPVPTSMDGRVLERAFKPEFLAAAPVRYTAESHLLADESLAVYSDEEMETISQRLRSLGYRD